MTAFTRKRDTELDSMLNTLSVREASNALSRRRFLQFAGAGGMALAVPFSMTAAELFGATPLGPNDGVLVVINLAGGIDGLNTVIPIADPAYARLRPSIAHRSGAVLNIGNGLGLHPAMGVTKGLWDSGKVAIVQGVSYPQPNLSHFESMEYWMTGKPGSRLGVPTGWLGRYTDSLGGSNVLASVSIGSTVPLTLKGSTTMGTSVPAWGGSLFGARSVTGNEGRDTYENRIVDAARRYSTNGRGTWASAVVANMQRSMDVADLLGPPLEAAEATGLRDWDRQAVIAANLINTDLGIRTLHLTWGGWDHHSDQRNEHDPMLADFDRSLGRLIAGLSTSMRSKVTVMVVSEFGRRPEENSSSGTDHGTANDVFVIGDGVAGGLYGAQPSLTNLDRDGNLIGSVDFRSVYRTMLDQVLRVDGSAILGTSIEALPLMAAGGSTTTSTTSTTSTTTTMASSSTTTMATTTMATTTMASSSTTKPTTTSTSTAPTTTPTTQPTTTMPSSTTTSPDPMSSTTMPTTTMPMTTTTMPTTTDPVTAVLPDGTIGAAPPGTPSTAPAGALPNTVPAGQEPLPAIPAPINRARSAGVVNDNSVSRNEPVTIGGSGFAPGALATITYRGVRLGIAYADANGAVVATVSIDMPRGSGRLEISGPWATPTPRRPTKYVSAPVRIRRS